MEAKKNFKLKSFVKSYTKPSKSNENNLPTLGYFRVKKVSRLEYRLESTPTSGFSMETPGSGFSLGASRLIF